MGSSISMLRADIKAHVKIAHDYPGFLEPNLCVARFLLELCEEGEGISPKDRNNPEVLERIKEKESEVSTEVELVAENYDVIDILLNQVDKYASMTPAPEFDTKKRYFARFRTPEPFPDLYDPVDDINLERCRVSLLRMALRCLRMITVIDDVKKQLLASSTVLALNRVVDENPLDEFIRKDVKAVFKNIYGGEQSVRRLETASLAITVDVMNDFNDSEMVQLAAIKRIGILVAEYTDFALCKDDILSLKVIQAIGNTLKTFPETSSDIYAHTCRLYTLLVPTRILKHDEELGLPHDEALAKVIGQNGGVEAAVNLLKSCRGFYTSLPSKEPIETNSPSSKLRPTSKIMQRSEKKYESTQEILEADDNQENGNQDETQTPKKLTDWSTCDLAQQALWALDVLSITEFNRIAMKREKLKYVLSEVLLGSKLIIPRRLRVLHWDEIGFKDADDVT